jgi:transposase
LNRSRFGGHSVELPDQSGVSRMGSTRRAYTEEYRRETVAYVINGDRSIAEVARNIGVHEQTLGRWVRDGRNAVGGESPDESDLSESERDELLRLRAEVKDSKSTIAELQMQVEFAKKVASWFARDTK